MIGKDSLDFIKNPVLLADWLDWMEKSGYTYRSMQNYLRGAYHFGSFLSVPHPVTSTLNKDGIKWNNNEITEYKNWVHSQCVRVTKKAKQQTLQRNSRESLEERKQWASMEEILTARDEMAKDIDSKLILEDEVSLENAKFIRNRMLVLFFTFGMPLRSQNLNEFIAHKRQNAETANRNTFVNIDDGYLEIVEYKNKK